MTVFDRLFRIEIKAFPRWKQNAVRLLQFLAHVLREFNKDYGFVQASGLAYTSLLSLVPLLAVMFALFTGFKAFESMKGNIQSFLLNYLVPAYSDQIQLYINQFMENTQTLSLFGMIGLLITAVLLFQNIKNSLNAIWSVKDNRSILLQFVIFTSVLIWGTVALAASFYLTGKIRGLIGQDQVGLFVRWVLSSFPLIFSFSAFILIMGVVPSTKVRFKSACLGGVTGAILWEIAKRAFQHYASGAITYSKIYGSLALIPIFLVWLYLTWVIVVLATEVTYVHQNFRALMSEQTTRELSTWDRVILSLQIYLFIAGRYLKGEPPTRIEDILDNMPVPGEFVQEIIDKFVNSTVLLRVEEPKSGYVPAQSLDRLRLNSIVETVLHNVRTDKHRIEDTLPTDVLARKIMADFEAAGIKTLNNEDISNLLKSC